MKTIVIINIASNRCFDIEFWINHWNAMPCISRWMEMTSRSKGVLCFNGILFNFLWNSFQSRIILIRSIEQGFAWNHINVRISNKKKTVSIGVFKMCVCVVCDRIQFVCSKIVHILPKDMNIFSNLHFSSAFNRVSFHISVCKYMRNLDFALLLIRIEENFGNVW